MREIIRSRTSKMNREKAVSTRRSVSAIVLKILRYHPRQVETAMVDEWIVDQFIHAIKSQGFGDQSTLSVASYDCNNAVRLGLARRR